MGRRCGARRRGCMYLMSMLWQEEREFVGALSRGSSERIESAAEREDGVGSVAGDMALRWLVVVVMGDGGWWMVVVAVVVVGCRRRWRKGLPTKRRRAGTSHKHGKAGGGGCACGTSRAVAVLFCSVRFGSGPASAPDRARALNSKATCVAAGPIRASHRTIDRQERSTRRRRGWARGCC
jgi:hypothetical protein